jgi:hypothetical protein
MLVVPLFQVVFSVKISTEGKGIGSVLIHNYLEKRQKQTVKAKQFQPFLKPDIR